MPGIFPLQEHGFRAQVQVDNFRVSIGFKRFRRSFTTLKGTRMLILARHTNQSIEIGNDITVKVLAVKGTLVRLGIKAPKHVPVHREEVARRIRQEQSEGP